MNDRKRVTFGVKTSQANTTYRRVLDVWRDADTIPVFEHAWLWDHLVPLRGDVTGPALEAWTLLAALAGQTDRLQVGVIVTSNRTRPPAVLAKMAATVDQISGGRLVLGIGAGGSRVKDPAGLELVRRELDAYGIDIVPTGEAIDALGEACTIVERLWAESQPFDFDGRHYRLRGAICEPKPVQRPRPPILIGAGGERSLRIVAEHADIWNWPSPGDFDGFRSRSQMLDDYAAAIGRDPADIVRSVQILVATEDAAAGLPRQSALPAITGPSETRDLILEYVAAGATHFVLAPVARDVDRPARWLADEVVEPVVERLAVPA